MKQKQPISEQSDAAMCMLITIVGIAILVALKLITDGTLD
jgi:hypothetical protein